MKKNLNLDHWDVLWQKGMIFDVHVELIALVKKFSPGKKILEIGYGTGGDLWELQKQGFDVHGIETSSIAHEAGKKLFGTDRAVFGSGESMPYQDETFDLIFHQGLLEHFKYPRRFMLEQRRVLKREGILIVDVPHLWNLYSIYRSFLQILGNWYGGWERSYSESQLRRLGEQCGYEVVDVQYRGIWPHQWGKWLFPERIVKNNVLKKLLTFPVIKLAQRFSRWAFDHSKLVRILSSYNIICVFKKRPLRIGLDARAAESSGGGLRLYLEKLQQDIIARGDVPVLFATQPLAINFTASEHQIQKIFFHTLFWEQVQLYFMIRLARIDLYHATQSMGVPALLPIPTILTFQDFIPLDDAEYFQASRLPGFSRIIYLLRVWLSLHNAKKIIVPIPHVARQILNVSHTLGKKFVMIPHGSDRFLSPTLPIKSATEPYILYHGGIAERKNIKLLLESFKIFSGQQSERWKLVITGTNSDLQPKYAAYSTSLQIDPDVVWTGWVSDEALLGLLHGASIVVYPSKFEGFGLPVIEAMALGKPVVAKSLPVIQYLAQSVPFYFRTNTASDLSQALVEASRGLTPRRQLLGKVLAAKLSWKKTCKMTYAAYISALAE